MLFWLIPLISIVILLFAVCLGIFLKIFFAVRRAPQDAEKFPAPPDPVYDPFREQIRQWVREIRAMEQKEFSITSFDGLTLYGKYYEYEKGAPIEILFHGYRGSAERDLCGGVHRCFAIGHNALIVDQRAAGKSDGHVITFGEKERRDCLAWVDFVIQHIDKEAKIILTGISMGAATVMMAASMELPSNVIGVLADCGYTSTQAIIKKVIRDMKLPADLLYPLVRIGARLFGGFDPEASSPIESMKKCKLPVIFFHGDTDDFVPCYMSEENYAACAADKKRLVIIPGAGHGLCFPVNQEIYLTELRNFFPQNAFSQ